MLKTDCPESMRALGSRLGDDLDRTIGELCRMMSDEARRAFLEQYTASLAGLTTAALGPVAMQIVFDEAKAAGMAAAADLAARSH